MPVSSILAPAIGAALSTVQAAGGLIIGVLVAGAAFDWIRRVIEGSASSERALREREASEAYEEFDWAAHEEAEMIKREGGVVDSSEREAEEAYAQFDQEAYEEREMIKREGGTV